VKEIVNFLNYQLLEMDITMIQSISSWVKEKGGKLGNIEIKMDNFRKPHIFAAKTIANEESALSIPIECILFDTMYTEDPLIRKLQQQKLDKEVVLSFILAKEIKNKDGPFANLIKTIPANFGLFPLYFNKNDFGFAQGTTINCIQF
jgi:hypothetical protein